MTTLKQPKTWISPPPDKCDLCGTGIKNNFIDGRTDQNGIWGFMCTDCHTNHGSGLGVGRGQMYTLQDDGVWLKTGG